ncbi:MAG: hypothetical protein JNK82_36925 [Myxococcaceae bacterium]|nr:hypothetical protein [Myxococcaceae bacterium]
MPNVSFRSVSNLFKTRSNDVTSATPAVTKPVSDMPATRLPPLDTTLLKDAAGRHINAERSMRSQSIRYELNANNGRYADGKRNVAQSMNAGNTPHPMHFVILPPDAVKFFAPAGDTEAAKILATLQRTLTDPKTGKQEQVVLLPVHWEEAKVLAEKNPALRIVTDGEVYASASPRSLFFGPMAGQVPQELAAIESYSVKTGLSAEAYKRLGGLGGSRELNYNDLLFASALSHAMERLKPLFSPYVEFQSEARTIAGRIPQGAGETVEVGAIFRELPKTPTVPGFALFSETTESLPHVPQKTGVVDVSRTGVPTDRKRILATEAIDFAVSKNPGMTREQAFLKLFVEPLLDVFFTMAKEGVTMELHPQNFSLKFSPDTGLVEKVVIRDLHGLGYDAAWRKQNGKEDVMSVESLRPAYPDITQEDINGYFMRNGEIRDRYKLPSMVSSTLDFFMSTFFYQLLNSTTPQPFDAKQIESVMNGIKGKIVSEAARHDFDLGQLPQPKGNSTYGAIADSGIRGKIVFRNRTDI